VAVGVVTPAAEVVGVALSAFPRCPASGAGGDPAGLWQDNDCLYIERSAFAIMGLSLRTENTAAAASGGNGAGSSSSSSSSSAVPKGSWRYTEWIRWDGAALAPVRANGTVGVELYNHSGDGGLSFDGAFEVANLAGQPQVAAVQAAFADLLRAIYPTWA
jgi:hypothetical protein